jgi:hypothetical protein
VPSQSLTIAYSDAGVPQLAHHGGLMIQRCSSLKAEQRAIQLLDGHAIALPPAFIHRAEPAHADWLPYHDVRPADAQPGKGICLQNGT